MKNSIFLLLTLCFLCQCSCKKSILANDDDDNPPMTELEKLPPITSEGANTFGCLVNGEAWTPKGYIFPEANFDVYFSELGSHRLFIDMYRKENSDSLTEFMTMGLSMVGNTTTIDFTKNRNVTLTQFSPCIQHRKVLEENFNISKLDTISKIISGTFDFVVTVEDGESCQDTMYITDGRFDAVYRY